ncbi:MAG: aldehyde ferredoxin oxidoreductase family protein [Anaerolineae bacterium]|nr:aldehyde ferredoxin oxidoreductase family protein [Anaerolineae bacterium]
MFGWHGKALRVDLTNETVSVEQIDPQMAKDYIGGRGWAIKVLHDEVEPTVDPLSPENKLIFTVGPLTGTPAPTGNRYMVTTKAPLTGAIACSNSGGMYPTEMKKTGFDMILLEGRAEHPVYLWINATDSEEEPHVEVRPADHLWGRPVPEATDALLEETDERARVACIGPAGERLVKMASIMNDKHRAAGRSGVGAVMGSKHLKAVVLRGTRDVPLAQPDQMRELCRQVRREVAADVRKGSTLREYGTAYVPIVTNELGILPTRNFQTGVFEGVEGITGQVLSDNYLIRPKPCYGCPIACGRKTTLEGSPYEGEGEGPEYETIASLGSACGLGDMAAVTKANYLCNELGMDTISTGMTIACAMELYEKGILPEEDVGMPLRFGDADAVIHLVEQIAYRDGFGDVLAEGSYRMAERYGHPELSITAKKQEFPGYDPRGSKGMGLLYATSNVGASHMAGDLAYMEVFGTPKKIDPLTVERKPWYIKHFEDLFTIIDAAGLCVFLSIRYLCDGTYDVMPTRMARLLNLAAGADYTVESLLEAGDRVYTLERLFLNRAGFSRADDTLPPRMLEEPMPEGPAQGHVVELEEMLPEFYELRGWDEKGIPTDEKLEELGLTP